MNKNFLKENIDEIIRIIGIFGIVLVCILSIIFMGITFCKSLNRDKVYRVQMPQSSFDKIACVNFEDSVYQYIIDLGIKHPDVVFTQAKLESGNFTSKIFRENNNMFGMRKASTRPSTSTGLKNTYATYDCWQDSVLDYALFQTNLNRNHFKSDNEYAMYISSFYAEDGSYYNKIKQ